MLYAPPTLAQEAWQTLKDEILSQQSPLTSSSHHSSTNPGPSTAAAKTSNRRSMYTPTTRPTMAREAWQTLKVEILGKGRSFRETQLWRGNLQPDDRLLVWHPEPGGV